VPDSVTRIGDFAFSLCADLTSITIGSGVREIGEDVFLGCFALTSIIYNGETYGSVEEFEAAFAAQH
jgi:hypothetical protein